MSEDINMSVFRDFQDLAQLKDRDKLLLNYCVF
jgi:hypothetical protein